MFPSSVRGCLCYTQQGKALRMILLVSMRELTRYLCSKPSLSIIMLKKRVLQKAFLQAVVSWKISSSVFVSFCRLSTETTFWRLSSKVEIYSHL